MKRDEIFRIGNIGYFSSCSSGVEQGKAGALLNFCYVMIGV